MISFFIVPNYYMNHPAKFETNRTILTYLNYRNELTVTDEHTDRQTDGRMDGLIDCGQTD